MVGRAKVREPSLRLVALPRAYNRSRRTASHGPPLKVRSLRFCFTPPPPGDLLDRTGLSNSYLRFRGPLYVLWTGTRARKNSLRLEGLVDSTNSAHIFVAINLSEFWELHPFPR